MTLREQVAHATERLVQAGVEGPEAVADAELLARHVLGWDRARYLVRRRDAVPDHFDGAYRPLIDRRVRREPISLITKRREFWGLEFEIKPGVLTPRPETELIIEASIDLIDTCIDAPLSVADIGTGSGCLAVALATTFRHATICAVDMSAAAVALARQNASAHGVADRVSVVDAPFSDWFTRRAVERPNKNFDLIVANLPYIPTRDIQTLPPEVRLYEPADALDGGPDGLAPLRLFLEVVPPCLKSDGVLIVEIGAGQDRGLTQAVASTPGLCLKEFRSDLQGIRRAAVIAPLAKTPTKTRT